MRCGAGARFSAVVFVDLKIHVVADLQSGGSDGGRNSHKPDVFDHSMHEESQETKANRATRLQVWA